jgi:hypothetical protein
MDVRIVVLILAVIGWLGSGLLSLICIGVFVLLMIYSITHLGPVMMNFKGILYLACTIIGVTAYITSLPSFYQGFMDIRSLFSRVK